MTRVQSPPGHHPILPTTIPPIRYPGIRNNDVSLPLLSRGASQPEILTLHVLLFPFQTDRSSYPYIRLYWIWANWVTHTTFRISPSKDSGTSLEIRPAWVRVSPKSHPIPPTAIPLKRYSTIKNSEASFPLRSESFHKIVARVWLGSLFLCPIRNSYTPPTFPLSTNNLLAVLAQNQPRENNEGMRMQEISLRVVKIQQWRRNPSLAPYSALSRGSKSLT